MQHQGFNFPEEYNNLFRHYKGYYSRMLELIFYKVDFVPNIILDLACGIGDYTKLLAEHFENSRIIGIDMSSDYINYASENNSLSNIEYYIAPAQSLTNLSWVSRIETIIVKGSYHLFESILPLSTFSSPHFNRLRQLIIIEKTERSLNTYPVPHSANKIRESYVSKELSQKRLQFPNTMTIKSLSYGEGIKIPFKDYMNAVIKKQFSYLQQTTTNEIQEWRSAMMKDKKEFISIYEENISNIYQLK